MGLRLPQIAFTGFCSKCFFESHSSLWHNFQFILLLIDIHYKVQHSVKWKYRIPPINSPPPKNSPPPFFTLATQSKSAPSCSPDFTRSVFNRNLSIAILDNTIILIKQWLSENCTALINERYKQKRHKWIRLCLLAHFNASYWQNQEGGGEFLGGKNAMVNFQFQKPPGEFDGRIRYSF